MQQFDGSATEDDSRIHGSRRRCRRIARHCADLPLTDDDAEESSRHRQRDEVHIGASGLKKVVTLRSGSWGPVVLAAIGTTAGALLRFGGTKRGDAGIAARSDRGPPARRARCRFTAEGRWTVQVELACQTTRRAMSRHGHLS